MKTIFFLFILVALFFQKLNAQDFETYNPPLGYRLKSSTNNILIYPSDGNGKPDLTKWRKLRSDVWFMSVGDKTEEINNITYYLITVPGINPDPTENAKTSTIAASHGTSIGPKDYDLNWWIAKDDLEENANVKYKKVASDVITGVLTAPFKLRLKTQGAKEAFFDGSFNIGGFIGYKMSFGTQKPSYLGLIGFTEVTTMKYTTADNTGITDPLEIQNGAGVSYGFGIVFRVKGVSPGFIMGWDHGLGDKGTTFLYQDHPWISFSLNYDFIKPKVEKEEKNK